MAKYRPYGNNHYRDGKNKKKKQIKTIAERESELEESLNLNQRMFAREYIKNRCNATKAYMIAYDKEVKTDNTRKSASEIKRNPKVKAYIDLLQKRILKSRKLTDEDLDTMISIMLKEGKIINPDDSAGYMSEEAQEIKPETRGRYLMDYAKLRVSMQQKSDEQENDDEQIGYTTEVEEEIIETEDGDINAIQQEEEE